MKKYVCTIEFEADNIWEGCALITKHLSDALTTPGGVEGVDSVIVRAAEAA